MLTPQIIIILFTILFLLAALYYEIFRPTVVFFIAILVFVFSGVLTPKEALTGFANEQLALIVLLLIISEIFHRSTAIDFLFHKIFGRAKSCSTLSITMMSKVAYNLTLYAGAAFILAYSNNL